MQRPERNIPSIRERHVSRFDYKYSLFSLVTSLLVFVCSMVVIAAMVYYNYPTKWTFVCYLASTGWILVMNITSNVVIIVSWRKARRGIQRTAMRAASVNRDMLNDPENSMREIQRRAMRAATVNRDMLNDPENSMRDIQRPAMRAASVNIHMLNDPENSRCLSSPPEIRSHLSSRMGQQCDSTSHTPPPPYEDLSLRSGETGCSAQGSGARYMELLPPPPEAGKERIDYHNSNRENRDDEYHQEYIYGQGSREVNLEGMTARWNQHGQLAGASSDRGVPGSSESAGRLMRMKFEERRNQLDRRLEGDSLRKMNEYCMRDLKRDGKKHGPEDLRQSSEPMMKRGSLNPKESLRQNLKAKYTSSADNLFADVDMSRVKSVCQSRMERCELPRVHMVKSTLSLPRSPKASRRPADVATARLTKSGLSLQDVRSKPDRVVDITAANEVGLPLEKTWRQNPLKMHDRAMASKNSDESLFARQFGENRSGRESGQGGISSSNLDKPFSVGQSEEHRSGRESGQRGISSSNLDKPFSVRQSGENRRGRESGQCGTSSSLNVMQERSLDSTENEQHPSHLPKAKDLPKGFRRDEGGF